MILEDTAARLIRYRGSDAPPGGIDAIFEEVADSDQLGDLLHCVLDKFSKLAARLRTDLPLLYAKLAEIALYDQDLDHRAAAELITAYRLYSTEIPELRDAGCGDIEAVLDDVNDRGRAQYVIVAVVDVWLLMLPELDSREGAKLLDEHLD